MTRLSELVEIRSGYTFRESIGNLPHGDTEVFQSGDLDNTTISATRPSILFPGSPSHLLKEGDVLLSARGVPKAYVYHGKNTAIASSSVLILRIKRSDILPEYIAAFFNSTAGVKEYLRFASNDALTTITKTNLGAVEIPDMPIEKQQTLSRLIATINAEREQLNEKIIHLDRIRTATLNKVLKENI